MPHTKSWSPGPRRYTIGLTRRIWSELTARPGSSQRAIAAGLGCSLYTVCRTIRILASLGYVRHEGRTARAITVVVPFAFIPAEDPPDDGPGQGDDIDGIPQGRQRR